MSEQPAGRTALDAHIEQLLGQMQQIAGAKAAERVRAAYDDGYVAGFAAGRNEAGRVSLAAIDSIPLPEGPPDQPTRQPKLQPDDSIRELELPVRVFNKLWEAGLCTIADLLEVDDEMLDDIHHFGNVAKAQLSKALQDASLERIPPTAIEDLGLPPDLLFSLQLKGVGTLRKLHWVHRRNRLAEFGDEDQVLIGAAIRANVPQ